MNLLRYSFYSIAMKPSKNYRRQTQIHLTILQSLQELTSDVKALRLP